MLYNKKDNLLRKLVEQITPLEKVEEFPLKGKTVFFEKSEIIQALIKTNEFDDYSRLSLDYGAEHTVLDYYNEFDGYDDSFSIAELQTLEQLDKKNNELAIANLNQAISEDSVLVQWANWDNHGTAFRHRRFMSELINKKMYLEEVRAERLYDYKRRPIQFEVKSQIIDKILEDLITIEQVRQDSIDRAIVNLQYGGETKSQIWTIQKIEEFLED